MSDEEKKAIQYLNKYCDTDLLYEQRHYNYIKMIIRLVGKQSKEIERINEILIWKQKYEEQLQKEIEELKFKYQARKDRTQKEIEELQEDIKYSANPLSIDNSKFGIKVLQSLLKEE